MAPYRWWTHRHKNKYKKNQAGRKTRDNLYMKIRGANWILGNHDLRGYLSFLFYSTLLLSSLSLLSLFYISNYYSLDDKGRDQNQLPPLTPLRRRHWWSGPPVGWWQVLESSGNLPGCQKNHLKLETLAFGMDSFEAKRVQPSKKIDSWNYLCGKVYK
jgi:hypothetical protein